MSDEANSRNFDTMFMWWELIPVYVWRDLLRLSYQDSVYRPTEIAALSNIFLEAQAARDLRIVLRSFIDD